MPTTISTRPTIRPTLLAASVAGLVLALAACGGASPAPSAGGSQGAARCEVTPDASPAATDTISGTSFGAEITIQAGQVVAFKNNDGFGHTVTEGTGGTAAANACVDTSIAAGGTVVVTFNTAGDYDVTCKIHSSMHNVIHVQ